MNTQVSKADVHIHTNYSADATARVEDVLEYVSTKTDLRVIAITDHDKIEGALEARRLAQAYNIEVIVGEEVSTQEGHLLALFIEEWLPPGRPAAETIAAVHAQGGLCIAAHPYARIVPAMGRYGLRERSRGTNREWHLDGVEGFNAALWMQMNNDMAIAVGNELEVAICGGSDSHVLSTIGLGYTLFPGTTANDLRAAIHMRKTVAAGKLSWPHIPDYLVTKSKQILQGMAGQALKPATS